MKLPTFLVIGTMKGGTTSLHLYLREHPQIFMSRRKELAFFGDEEMQSQGLDLYASHFADAQPHEIARGESSPHYTSYPARSDVPESIVAALGRVPLIYLVRDPIDRIVSHYHQLLGKGHESRTLNEAVLIDPDYINRSSYAMQLDQYMDHFSRDDILVLKSEDLMNDRRQALKRVFAHVGVDPDWYDPVYDWRHHVTKRKRLPRAHVERFRNTSPYRKLSEISPRALKTALTRLNVVSTPVVRRGGLDPAVRGELVRRLLPDLTRLTAYMDPSFDAWGLL
jgi:hypothetical protein